VRSQTKPTSRIFRRKPARIPVALLVNGQHRKVREKTAILQTSFLGVRIRTDVVLKPGEDVQILRMTGPQTGVPARVVWVGSRGSNWAGHAGLKFTDPLHARISAH